MAFATSTTRSANLIAPYGGKLVNLLVGDEERRALTEVATRLPSIQLSARSICDLEMLAVGAFSPLDRFMGKRDYKCVLNESRLASGHVFPIPITLSVEATAEIQPGQEVALRDVQNNLLAVMSIQEVYEWDADHEASCVFRSKDPRHPYIAAMHRLGKLNISGPLRVVSLPNHHHFGDLCLTPAETRQRLQELGHANVVALLSPPPLSRTDRARLLRAVQKVAGSLLLHPVVGMANLGGNRAAQDFSYRMLTDCNTACNTAADDVMLALWPLAMRMAGPREAVWQMILQRNYGANHLILSQNRIGLGNEAKGNPFCDPAETEEIAQLYSGEIEVNVLPFKTLNALADDGRNQAEGWAVARMRYAPITPSAWA